jgi:putative transposase
MSSQFLTGYHKGSFHMEYDLAPLVHMIKIMSQKLSDKAKQHLQWMDSYRNCENAAQVCRHFSIPKRTFWRWKKKYNPWDLTSLEDKPKKPRSSPRKTPWDIEKQILSLKKIHPRWGKEKIALVMKRKNIDISGKTCWKILDIHRLMVRYKTRKRKPLKPRVNIAKIHTPNALLQLDTKYVSLYGRQYFQYTIIDVISRVRYADIYQNLDMKTTIAFLEQTIPQMKTKIIQTDNGKEFGKEVSKWLTQKGIRHVFSHKSRPQENAYVERSHRTDEEEFYSSEPLGTNLQELRTNFARYLKMYNTERPHWGLGGKTPMEALNYYLLTQKVCHMS